MAHISDSRQFVNPEDITPDALNQRFRRLYENHDRMDYTTTNPDGAREGKRGEFILLLSGGTYYIEVNVDSGTVWRGVALSNTP